MRVGVALGGGGAKGLAHIPVLETLDALGVRPVALAGSSIGAVFAALYASGIPASRIRSELDAQLFRAAPSGPGKTFDLAKSVQRLIELTDFDIGSGGLFSGGKFVNGLFDRIPVRRFEDLTIPLKVVACEFWTREEVVIDSGDLLTAVRASMALPVIFSPVVLEGQVLMDGGAVNPLPYDVLLEDCDAVIAVDVGGSRTRDPENPIPSFFESIFNTFQIMSKAIVDQKLRHRPPAILVKPEIPDVLLLEFDRAQEIYAHCEPACAILRKQLTALLSERDATSRA